MTDSILVRRSHFGKGLGTAAWDEQGIVAKSVLANGRPRNPSCEDPCSERFSTVGETEGSDCKKSGSAIVYSCEPFKEKGVVP